MMEEIEYIPNKTFKIKAIQPIHRKIEVTPFVYGIVDKPITFKLVLMWELIVKNVEQTIEIVKLTAEESFVIEKNITEHAAKMLVQSSYMHFEDLYVSHKPNLIHRQSLFHEVDPLLTVAHIIEQLHKEV